MTLDQLPPHVAATIATVTLSGSDLRRVTALGLRQGARIEVLRRAPFGGPLALRVAGGVLALRRSQASRIVVAEEAHRA